MFLSLDIHFNIQICSLQLMVLNPLRTIMGLQKTGKEIHVPLKCLLGRVSTVAMMLQILQESQGCEYLYICLISICGNVSVRLMVLFLSETYHPVD